MSDQEQNPKPSLKDRLKPHLPVAVICLSAGVIIGLTLNRPAVINITNRLIEEPSSDVWFSDRMVNQLKEHGSAMIQLEKSGALIDLIDWAHPNMENKKVA